MVATITAANQSRQQYCLHLAEVASLASLDKPTMKPPLVSVVICTKNRCDALKRYALASLELLNYPCFEIVVVDDASSDGTQDFIRQYKHDSLAITVVRNEQSRGLCHARNVGVRNSKGEIIAFIDDDCAVTPSWMAELVAAYDSDDIAVVGGVSHKGDTNEIYIDDRNVWGCNMSFKASIFNQFQFDTGLKYSHYADETDLIGRITAHGFRRVVAIKALAKHYVEAADYRKKIPLSGYLNYHYLNAKRGSLHGYYRYVFSKSLKYVALVEYGLNFKGQKATPIQTLMAIVRKSLYYSYVLLLEIPVTAKFKHAQEEALFRRQRTQLP